MNIIEKTFNFFVLIGYSILYLIFGSEDYDRVDL